VDWMHLG